MPSLDRSSLDRSSLDRSSRDWAEPAFYPAFQCIGALCEDTCCQGWGVAVDRATYQKYQACSDTELGPKLKQLVTIADAASDLGYAAIQIIDARCPFLDAGLCSIQNRLGVDYLSRACATYPRVCNAFAGYRERSLNLSCPEAARLALLDPKPLEFGEFATAADSGSRVRKTILGLLQNRDYPIAQRLLWVGHICDRWSGLAAASASEQAKLQFLDAFRLGDVDLTPADPTTQLATVLDLMVVRIQLDYTSPRYLDLCREFVAGLQLKDKVSREEFGSRYAEAYRLYYAPFMQRHEYMWEHYLAAYAFKTMLPFGSPPVSRLLNLPQQEGVYAAQYMLMATYFSIAKAVLIGLAGKHKAGFSVQHVVHTIQSVSRTLEHCQSYPACAMQFLAGRGIRSSSGMALLIRN